jgi:histidinol dehydrogenase
MVARFTGGEEVAGSNPVIPTNKKASNFNELEAFWFYLQSQIFVLKRWSSERIPGPRDMIKSIARAQMAWSGQLIG